MSLRAYFSVLARIFTFRSITALRSETEKHLGRVVSQFTLTGRSQGTVGTLDNFQIV